MKSFKSLTTVAIITCLLLVPVFSSGAPTPSHTQEIPAENNVLSQLFRVAAAKEPIYLILIEKDLQRLRVFEYDRELKVVAEYFSATGENFGNKEVSGDSKTPEGIYFITRIFKDDKVTIFGDKAFHLDYPNIFDLRAGRTGNGIYIHGTNKELKPNSTNGCVTLDKDDLDKLDKYLNQVVTPVVIVSKMDSIKTNTQLLTENDFQLAKSLLLWEGIKPEKVEYSYLYLIGSGTQTVAVSDFVYRPFSRSIMHGTSKTYLQYNPAQGWTIGKRIWQASPLQIYPEGPVKIADRPFATDGIVIAGHNPRSTAKPAQHELKKTQHKKTALTGINKPKVTKVPVTRTTVTPSHQKETEKKVAQKKIEVQAPAIAFDQQQILNFVESWRKAWVSQQIEPYIAFYDKSFRSANKNLAEWKKFKEIINKTYSYITVDISGIKIHRTADGARVSFRQKYLSDHYSSTGNKILYLVHDGSGWKIKREFYSGS
ncbi:murein L,D-transpeptidase family protein [Thermodesulfobacteriota bacterium]